MKRLTITLFATALLFGGAAWLAAQQSGGAFLPNFNYSIGGLWNFTNSAGAFQVNGTTVSQAQVAELKTSGVVILDGSNPTSVTMSPLSSINGCTATIHGSVAPGLDPSQVSVVTRATAGQLDIYAWKVTASNDATLIASTIATRYIDYVCTGT